MAASMVQTPPSPDQDGSLLDAQGYLPRDYPQTSWDYTATSDHSPLAPPNGMWQGALPCYDTPPVFDAPLNGPIWPHYGTATADGPWDHPQVDGSPSFASYGPAWPLSPADTLPNNPWSPTDQPLPSPLSEVPSYALTQSPWGEDQATTRSGTNSPITITTNSALPTPVLKAKGKPKKNRNTTLPPKRPAETIPLPPRPRTLKRHKSDTPSISSILTDRTTGSTSTSASTTTTLGGVLPANVDPRVAAEQIRREAWERCKAEALEMSQRRMMLLDHEHGALERETQRLQINLGRMREVAKRGQAGGLERDGEEEGRVHEGGWVDGGS